MSQENILKMLLRAGRLNGIHVEISPPEEEKIGRYLGLHVDIHVQEQL